MSTLDKKTEGSAPTDQVTMVDLWRQIRGLENALRHYGDVFAGWMEYGGKEYDATIPGLDRLTPIPLPPCNPPWCIPPTTIPRTVREMAQVAVAVKEVADALQLVAKDLTLKAEHIYVSELPGTHWPWHDEDHDGHR
jgi:hypothetical protein